MSGSVTERTNILIDIRNLQISPWRNPLRKKHRIMRKIICQESSKFTPVWEETSSKAIFYESDRIYFNNYRKCYASFGCSGLPELLYKLPNCPSTEKIEDALVCEFNTDRVSTLCEDYRSHLITLTRNGYLCLLDLDTGRTIKKVFLSDKYKFRSLSWNSPGESFSVKANVRSLLNMVTHWVTFIVFEVFPLRLHSHIAINKQTFKKSIVDGSIFQGLLIVLHSGNLIRLFSYDRIVQEHTSLSVTLDEVSSDGIPHTVTLKDMPPILFELRCNEHNLWLGGVPLHYLYQPTNDDVYKVCQLKTEEVVERGSIPVWIDAYETESLHFLSDDSNRLVHVTVSSAQILKINVLDDGSSRIDKLFTIEPHIDYGVDDGGGSSPGQMLLMSSSGRIIKRSWPVDESVCAAVSSRIHSVQYDNDLRLMVATSLSAEQYDGGYINGFVCLYDEETGEKVKTIELNEPWDDTYEHTVALDLDTLIHIYRDHGEHYCVVYRLDRSISEDADEKRPKR